MAILPTAYRIFKLTPEAQKSYANRLTALRRDLKGNDAYDSIAVATGTQDLYVVRSDMNVNDWGRNELKQHGLDVLCSEQRGTVRAVTEPVSKLMGWFVPVLGGVTVLGVLAELAAGTHTLSQAYLPASLGVGVPGGMAAAFKGTEKLWHAIGAKRDVLPEIAEEVKWP